VGQLISEPTTVTIGGTEIVLHPSASGETGDALMAYLPTSGVLFTGDVMMPYLGAPFFAEGSPNGLIETLEFITALRPRLLVQGHTTLTELFTMDAVAGLLPALRELRERALAGNHGRPDPRRSAGCECPARGPARASRGGRPLPGHP
jgi:glyoxylase-like metal-dependent hydrolase (beta-lactamase superfamily II)